MESIQTKSKGRSRKMKPKHKNLRLGAVCGEPFCNTWRNGALSWTIGKAGYLLFITSFLLFLTLSSGCGNRFFDPTQVGRFRSVPSVNVILDSLGVAEETPVAWEKAEEPKPSDIIADESDYMFLSGDIVRVTIFELLQEGAYFVNDYVVTETGKVSIPEVGIVEVAGLTETQLEEEIKQILSPSILKEPSVSVALIRSQQHMFSILGDGVLAPGRYFIPRFDFRLTDALALSGGPRQFNVSYIYVSRFVGEKEKISEPSLPKLGEPKLGFVEPELSGPEKQLRDIIASRAQHQYQWPESKVVITSSEMMTDEPISVKEVLQTLSERSRRQKSVDERVEDVIKSLEEPSRRQQRIYQQTNLQDRLRPSISSVAPKAMDKRLGEKEAGRIKWVEQDGKWIPVQITPPKSKEEEEAGHIEWIFRNGKWIPVQVGPPKPIRPVIEIEPEEQLVGPLEEEVVPVFERDNLAKARLIKIPADKLLAGDPRYNIVIKPGDAVLVPVDIIGEFCIMGNVNRPGYINITGRPMTLKMAIAAAGGLGPLAWPKRCEVVRRIGREKEEIVRVDLDKIARGEQPDFFIKPNDLINVGTHATSRWRAILRNAFRATYGFGFVYDRNFAYKDYWGTTYSPIPPWKWDNVF